MTAHHPLRSWRVARGLTVDQVAGLVETSPSAVRNYELGRRVPHPVIMARIEMVTLRRVRASVFLPDLRGSFLSGPTNSPEPVTTEGAGSVGDDESNLVVPGHLRRTVARGTALQIDIEGRAEGAVMSAATTRPTTSAKARSAASSNCPTAA